MFVYADFDDHLLVTLRWKLKKMSKYLTTTRAYTFTACASGMRQITFLYLVMLKHFKGMYWGCWIWAGCFYGMFTLWTTGKWQKSCRLVAAWRLLFWTGAIQVEVYSLSTQHLMDWWAHKKAQSHQLHQLQLPRFQVILHKYRGIMVHVSRSGSIWLV